MNAMLRAVLFLDIHRITTAKVLVGVLVGSCSLLAVAQSSTHSYKSATSSHTSRPLVRTTADKQPRSVPSSAVPQAIGASNAVTRNELNRLEQMGTPRTGNIGVNRSTSPARVPSRAASVSKVRTQNPPINFTYQAPGQQSRASTKSRSLPRQ